MLCELNSPQRGPVGENLRRELVASEARAERPHNMCCVIVEGSKANAQTRRNEHRSDWPVLSCHPAERSAFDFSAVAESNCLHRVDTRDAGERSEHPPRPVSNGFRLCNEMQQSSGPAERFAGRCEAE